MIYYTLYLRWHTPMALLRAYLSIATVVHAGSLLIIALIYCLIAGSAFLSLWPAIMA
jgi:hypothetical protein